MGKAQRVKAPGSSPERGELLPRFELPVHTQLTALGVRTIRCRVNTAHVRQSRPDSGLGFQVKVLKTF